MADVAVRDEESAVRLWHALAAMDPAAHEGFYAELWRTAMATYAGVLPAARAHPADQVALCRLHLLVRLPDRLQRVEALAGAVPRAAVVASLRRLLESSTIPQTLRNMTGEHIIAAVTAACRQRQLLDADAEAVLLSLAGEAPSEALVQPAATATATSTETDETTTGRFDANVRLCRRH